mmetsp:Transcript_7783/g.25500  ORF Transcript_7783/g.25500 Transcript_7783/m.25500 type:complete len:303 (-) Transcript_7783:349-1257(-)
MVVRRDHRVRGWGRATDEGQRGVHQLLHRLPGREVALGGQPVRLPDDLRLLQGPRAVHPARPQVGHPHGARTPRRHDRRRCRGGAEVPAGASRLRAGAGGLRDQDAHARARDRPRRQRHDEDRHSLRRRHRLLRRREVHDQGERRAQGDAAARGPRDDRAVGRDLRRRLDPRGGRHHQRRDGRLLLECVCAHGPPLPLPPPLQVGRVALLPAARRRAHPLLCRREDGGRVLPLPRQRLHLARRHRRLAHRRRRRLAAPEPTHDRRGCEQRGAGREAARRRCGLKPQPGRLRARSSLLRAGSI